MPPCTSLLLRELVPEAQSRASRIPVRSPRVAASSAVPAPTIPPPTTSTSSSRSRIAASACCRPAGLNSPTPTPYVRDTWRGWSRDLAAGETTPAGWALPPPSRLLGSRGCGAAVGMRGVRGSAVAVGGDDDLDTLELLEIGVPRRRHRPPQRTDEVHATIRLRRRAEEQLLERRERADLHPGAARQLRVVRLGTPVPAAAGGLLGARERRAEHDRIRAHRHRLHDVAARAQTAVRDHMHIAAPRLVEVITAGARDIRDRRRHRGVDAERGARRARRAAAEADEHARGARAHEVPGRGVGGGAADEQGYGELVDEL